MKLRTKLVLPSILFMLILCGLGVTQLYINHVQHEQDEQLTNLEERLLSISDVLSERIESHFKNSLQVLTEIETDKFIGVLDQEKAKFKQIEINIKTYLESLSHLLNELPDSLNSPVTTNQFQTLDLKLDEYFSATERALTLMPDDEDSADAYLMLAAKLSIEARGMLRTITRAIEQMVHQAEEKQHHQLGTFLSLFWWISLAGALLFSIAFAYYSSYASNKIETVLTRFRKLFPQAELIHEVKGAHEGIAQLEWLADSLEKTKKDLHTSQNQLDQLISESSIAIYVHRHMKPLFANQAWADLCGFEKPTDLLKLNSTIEVLAPHERQRVTDIHEARLKGEKAPSMYELEVLHTDGSTRWALNKSFVIDWEGEKAVCTTLIDITDRKTAEQRLNDSEDRFQELLELTPDPIYIHSVEGKILDVNQAACQSLGFAHDEFKTMSIEEIAPSSSGSQTQYFWKTAKPNASLIKSVQTYHVRKDGSRFPVEVNITSGIFDGQKVILAMAHDMTETMEHIAELDELRKQAEEASKTKSEFLSMMSHELRTPLNSIIGYSDLYLQAASKRENVENEVKWIEQVKASGEDLLGIIDKVLDLTAIDKEHETHVGTASDLLTQTNTALEVLSRNAEAKNITITKAYPDTGPAYINASEKALYVIAENLISNAIKFNKDGGTVVISLTEYAPDTYKFMVQDTGIGIDKEQHHLAFQPFNRLGHENGPIAGNGIGLTLVQKLVEYIGARIEISTPEDGGCCFTVYLPKATIT